MDRRIFPRAASVVIVLVACGATLSYRTAPIQAQTNIGVNLSFFYDRLAPYGEWIDRPPYNWVWCPRDVPVNWRPYTDGRWVYTDDYGWVWDSDLPWGWACFHYGRWDWDENLGWFWVPGYVWGPAWVAWSTAPGYIGWAPLPPVVGWRAGMGLDFHGFDIDDLPARRWCFVPERLFDEPTLRSHILLPARNVGIFPERRIITRFDIVGGRIVNVGVPVRQLEQATGRPVPHFQVRHVDSAAAVRLPRESSGVVNVFSPRVRQPAAGAVPPRADEFERRQQAARTELQERQQAERAQLQEQQQAERAATQRRFQTGRPSTAGNAEQLQRQREAEMRALQSEHERQQRLLSNRQREESERMEPGRMARAPGGFGRPSRR